MKKLLKNKKIILTLLALLYFGGFYAVAQDFSGAQSIADLTPEYLITPFIPILVYVGTWAARKFLGIKNLPAIVTLLVVTVLSTVIPLLEGLFLDESLPYLARVGLGLTSVFFNQVSKNISQSQTQTEINPS